MIKRSLFRYFKTSLEIICVAVMMYAQFPPSHRNIENLLHDQGIDISHKTVRFRWKRFGPLFATEVRKRQVSAIGSSQWRWHVDEVFVRIKGQQHCFRRIVDQQGELFKSIVTKTRDKEAVLKLDVFL